MDPKPRIALVADDDPVGRLLLQQAVRVAGLQPLAFGDGVSALEAGLAQDVDLVLLDGAMPGMDGFEVCARLRADPRLATVPIVIFTGQEDHSAVTQAFKAGATDFIPKPVNFVLLPFRIEYMLRNAARESQVLTLVEALPDRLWVASGDGRIHWAAATSTPAAAAPGTAERSLWDELDPASVHPELHAALDATARDGTMRKIEYARPEADGPHHYELRLTRRAGGDVVVVRRDISERVRAGERIERLAYYDVLTGLPNRQRCLETAQTLLDEARARGTGVAVLYMDLSGFKRINDTFGHAGGDSVLRSVAQRLTIALESMAPSGITGTLARFGGDEFVCLIARKDTQAAAREAASVFNSALRSPVAYDRFELHTAPTIGIAVYPRDGPEVADLFKHADTAMFHARSTGVQTVAFYHPSMTGRRRSSAELEARLRRAISTEALELHYQPKYRLADGSLAGLEALARWWDPEHGEISPGQFIPVAEESSLIIDLGAWVLRAACRQIRDWQQQGLAIPVAVNVSAKELLFSDPAGILAREAAEAGISPSLVEIEITESVMVQDSNAVIAALQGFRELGCRIALDDFGTGYSSLSYITRLRPDRIKIDRSFVQNLDSSAADAAIAGAILSLGHTLNLTVTAEGIEQKAQLEWLRRRGCDEGQGFLLARPGPASRIAQWRAGPQVPSVAGPSDADLLEAGAPAA